jgi:hypothetical protein
VSYLYPYRAAVRAAALTIAEPAGSPAQGQVIHYTRLASCTKADTGYLMPCYGLADHAPAPGTIALYDNEKWRLTPSAEQADPCGSAVDFAAKVRAVGATPAKSYGATAYRLAQDFKTVRAAHPTWVCWLNVITWDGSQRMAVRMFSYLK